MKIAILDTETTDLLPEKGGITEVAVILIDDGIMEQTVLAQLESFNDPGHPIPQEVVDLTGITDEMVRGKSIDAAAFQAVLDQADLVVAQHAAFDRNWVESKLSLTAKAWGCSKLMVPWPRYVPHTSSQRYLMFEHGFIPSSHRALSDCKDLLVLLNCSPKDRLVQRPASSDGRYLDTLIENQAKDWFICLAHNSPFSAKDFLKANGFRWGGKPPWYRIHSVDEGPEVRKILKEAGCEASAKWVKVDPCDPGLLKRFNLE